LETLKVWGPPGPFSCEFFGRRGQCHHACGALLPHAVKETKRRVHFEKGGCKCHDIFLIELAGSQMLCGKNVMSRITFLPVKIPSEIMIQNNFYCTLPENFSSFQVTQMHLETRVWKCMRLEMHASGNTCFSRHIYKPHFS
jgi:hypothetical protein